MPVLVTLEGILEGGSSEPPTASASRIYALAKEKSSSPYQK